MTPASKRPHRQQAAFNRPVGTSSINTSPGYVSLHISTEGCCLATLHLACCSSPSSTPTLSSSKEIRRASLIITPREVYLGGRNTRSTLHGKLGCPHKVVVWHTFDARCRRDVLPRCHKLTVLMAEKISLFSVCVCVCVLARVDIWDPPPFPFARGCAKWQWHSSLHGNRMNASGWSKRWWHALRRQTCALRVRVGGFGVRKTIQTKFLSASVNMCLSLILSCLPLLSCLDLWVSAACWKLLDASQLRWTEWFESRKSRGAVAPQRRQRNIIW